MAKRSGKNYAYGFHALSALIRQSPERIIRVHVDKNKKDVRTTEFIDLLKANKIDFEFCQRDVLQKHLGEVVHQGVMAIISGPAINKRVDLNDAFECMSADETILILDGVQDPMNLGSCLRVADAAGVKHVIFPKDKSASVTAVTRKVSAGASESLCIHTVTNLIRTVDLLKQHNFWIIGMADETDSSLYQYQFNGRVAIILGNEGKGLRHLTRKACDEILAIPMLGEVESLNVATATAVSLFEISRQRNARK